MLLKHFIIILQKLNCDLESLVALEIFAMRHDLKGQDESRDEIVIQSLLGRLAKHDPISNRIKQFYWNKGAHFIPELGIVSTSYVVMDTSVNVLMEKDR